MECEYIAYDGRRFVSAEACQDYETFLNEAVRMWDSFGCPTENIEDSAILYLGSQDVLGIYGGLIFQRICERAGKSCFNIHAYSAGWYYWDGRYERYNYINDALMGGLFRAFKDVAQSASEEPAQ